MTQPYYSPTYPIQIPKLIGRRYYFKIADTSDDLLRAPADGSFLSITSALTRPLSIEFEDRVRSDGTKELEYAGREPLQIQFTILTMDERDRDRLISWQYLNYDISLMEIYEDDVGNPHLFMLGPIEVERWKIIDISATNTPGNLTTGTYNITLKEKSFTDIVPNVEDGFSPFRYAIKIGANYVPSSWDPTTLGDPSGLKMDRDPSRNIALNFASSQIAYGSEIIEYKGRANLELAFNFTTTNYDEISLLEWAKDTVATVEVYEWAEYAEMSTHTPSVIGRLLSIALTDVTNTYSLSPLTQITPTKWRIVDLTFYQASLSEFAGIITLKEIF